MLSSNGPVALRPSAVREPSQRRTCASRSSLSARSPMSRFAAASCAAVGRHAAPSLLRALARFVFVPTAKLAVSPLPLWGVRGLPSAHAQGGGTPSAGFQQPFTTTAGVHSSPFLTFPHKGEGESRAGAGSVQPRLHHAAARISSALALSRIAATPMPPAVHTEIRPRPPCADSSLARFATMRAPVAANGWPNAIEEPFTLRLLRSIEPSGWSLPRCVLQYPDPPRPAASPAPARRTPRIS